MIFRLKFVSVTAFVMVSAARAEAQPAAMQAVTVQSQQGTTGHAVGIPPGVIVRNANGAGVPGVTVVFVLLNGGGTITPSTRVTDSNGRARLDSWILGPSAGANSLVAKVTGLPAVSFSANASAPVAPAPAAAPPPAPPAPVSVSATASIPLAPTPLPDLTVAIHQEKSPLVAGSTQTYALKIYNRGPGRASGVTVRSNLPSDLSFARGYGDHHFVCTQTGTCSGAIIEPGDSASIVFQMGLSRLARGGHEIIFGTRADPDNAIIEQNESNNQASAATVTQALIEPLVNYRLTADSDLREVFTIAKQNGFTFTATSLDKDMTGKPVSCWIGTPDGNQGTPLMGAMSGVPPIGTEFRCLYEFFGKTKKLATGWQLISTEWTSGWGSSSAYVEAPVPSSGSAFFSRQLRWNSPISGDGREWITSITLKGPVDANWRDAFR